MAEIETYDANGIPTGYMTVEDAPVVATAKPAVETLASPVTEDYAFTGTGMMPDITGGIAANYTVASTPETVTPSEKPSLMASFLESATGIVDGAKETAAKLAGADAFMKDPNNSFDQRISYLRDLAPEEQRAELNSFVAVVKKYPDLEAGLDATIRDEGFTGLATIKSALAGEGGAFNAEQFDALMAKDSYRAVAVSALEQTGTDKANSLDLVKFMRLARDAQTKKDPASLKAFEDQAKLMGVEGLNAAKGQAMMDAFENMSTQDMLKLVQDFLRNPMGYINAMFENFDVAGMAEQFATDMGINPEVGRGFIEGFAQPGSANFAGLVLSPISGEKDGFGGLVANGIDGLTANTPNATENYTSDVVEQIKAQRTADAAQDVSVPGRPAFNNDAPTGGATQVSFLRDRFDPRAEGIAPDLTKTANWTVAPQPALQMA